MPEGHRPRPRDFDDRARPISVRTDREVIRSLLSPAGVRLHRALSMVSLVAALFSVGFAAFLLAGSRGDAMTYVTGIIAAIMGTGFLAAAWGLWAAKRSNPALLLAHGRCGQCIYIIHGLMPESDGCVVCPECGAAWKSASIGKLSRAAGSQS